jgi:hypothetical protein
MKKKSIKKRSSKKNKPALLYWFQIHWINVCKKQKQPVSKRKSIKKKSKKKSIKKKKNSDGSGTNELNRIFKYLVS